MRARLIRSSCTSYVMLVRCQPCFAITMKGTRKSMRAMCIKRGERRNSEPGSRTATFYLTRKSSFRSREEIHACTSRLGFKDMYTVVSRVS